MESSRLMEAAYHHLRWAEGIEDSDRKVPPVLSFLCDFCFKSLLVLLPRSPCAGWLLLFAITVPSTVPFLK
jgi:hypothetical protein